MPRHLLLLPVLALAAGAQTATLAQRLQEVAALLGLEFTRVA